MSNINKNTQQISKLYFDNVCSLSIFMYLTNINWPNNIHGVCQCILWINIIFIPLYWIFIHAFNKYIKLIIVLTHNAIIKSLVYLSSFMNLKHIVELVRSIISPLIFPYRSLLSLFHMNLRYDVDCMVFYCI